MRRKFRYDFAFRVEAGSGIGLGHLRRILALAEALRRKGIRKSVFAAVRHRDVAKWAGGFAILRLRSKTVARELREIREFQRRDGAAVWVVDRYGYRQSFFRKLSTIVPKTVVIDDEGRLDQYPVDVIVNHNAYAAQIDYRPASAGKFLGSRYALISDEFRRLRPKGVSRKVRKVFVSLGGYAKARNLKKIRLWLEKAAKGKLQLLSVNGRTKGVASRMRQADLAVSAAGITSYELAYFGIPSALITVAKNQEKTARTLAGNGAAVHLGSLKSLNERRFVNRVGALIGDRKIRARLSARARRVVDGKGALRLAEGLKHLLEGN